MGDPNASIPTPQPVHYRMMFGALGGACAATSYTFVSKAAMQADIKQQLDLKKMVAPVGNTRNIRKKDMVLNNYQPVLEVDSQTYEVKAECQILTCEAAERRSWAYPSYLL